jgi:hypothetical protein
MRYGCLRGVTTLPRNYSDDQNLGSLIFDNHVVQYYTSNYDPPKSFLILKPSRTMDNSKLGCKILDDLSTSFLAAS